MKRELSGCPCDHRQIIVIDAVVWLYSTPALLQPNNKKKRTDNIFLWINGARWSSSSIARPPLKPDLLKIRKQRKGKDAAWLSVSEGRRERSPPEHLLPDLACGRRLPGWACDCRLSGEHHSWGRSQEAPFQKLGPHAHPSSPAGNIKIFT